MTEFQFIADTAYYQRRFEKLHLKLIYDMNSYIRSNPVHNSVWLNRIQFYSDYITLTYQWVNVLKKFNSDLTGVPVVKTGARRSGTYPDVFTTS